jgi:hypothetical protein
MGADLEEVYANAMDALGEWVRDARDAGFDPKPRDILELRKDRDVLATLEEGGSFLLVPLLIESGRSVRANISMDQGLLESIDEAAKRIGVTRSSFLASAARDKIAALARGPSATSARSVPTLAEPDG